MCLWTTLLFSVTDSKHLSYTGHLFLVCVFDVFQRVFGSVAQSIWIEYHLITAINHRPRKPQTLCFFSIMYQSAVSLPGSRFENAQQSTHSPPCLSGSTSLVLCESRTFFMGRIAFQLFEMKPSATGAPSVTPLSLSFTVFSSPKASGQAFRHGC